MIFTNESEVREVLVGWIQVLYDKKKHKKNNNPLHINKKKWSLRFESIWANFIFMITLLKSLVNSGFPESVFTNRSLNIGTDTSEQTVQT